MNFFKSKDPDIAEVSREKRVKESIITELSVCLKNIQATQQARRPGEPIYTSDSSNHLCTVMEAIFLHGHKSTQGFKRQQTDNKAFDRCSFWSFVQRFTHRDTIGQLKRLAHVKTETGVCRAWIILAVNDGLMESYITAILAQPSVLRQFYIKTALLRDIEQPDILLKLIRILAAASYDFQLVYNSSQLNVWGMKTLALAGLVERHFVSDSGSRNSSHSSLNYNRSTSTLLEQSTSSTLDMEDFPNDVFSFDQNTNDLFNRSSSSSDRLSQHTSGSFNQSNKITVSNLDQSSVLPGDSLQQTDTAVGSNVDTDLVDSKSGKDTPTDGSSRSTSKAIIHDCLHTLGEDDTKSADSGSCYSVGSAGTSISSHSSKSKITDSSRSKVTDSPRLKVTNVERELARLRTAHYSINDVIKSDPVSQIDTSTPGTEDVTTGGGSSHAKLPSPKQADSKPGTPPLVSRLESLSDQELDDGVYGSPAILGARSKFEDINKETESSDDQSEAPVYGNSQSEAPVYGNSQSEAPVQGSSVLEAPVYVGDHSDGTTQGNSYLSDFARHDSQSDGSLRTNSQSEGPSTKVMLAKFTVGTPQSHSEFLSSHELPENDSEEDDDEGPYGAAYGRSATTPSETATSPGCEESPYSDYPLSAAQAIMNKRLSGAEAAKPGTQASSLGRSTHTATSIGILTHGNSLASLTGWGNPDQEETTVPNSHNSAANVTQVQSLADLVSGSRQAPEESFGSPIRDSTVAAGAESAAQCITVVEEEEAADEQTEYADVLANYGKLCTEEGLDAQDYKCITCSAPIGIIYGMPRVCAYTKKYYCSQCHVNEDSYLPAKIVYNCDFAKYKVCKYSKDFLTSAESMPLLNLKFLNPTVYEHVPALEAARVQRTQLVYLKRYLFACNPTVAEELKQKFWPKEYLYEEIHTYSVQDLLVINTNSTLANQMKKGIKFARSHVQGCESCEYRGFHCEICGSRQVIFPFDLDTTSRCEKCNGVYHKACLTGDCPKCERIRHRDLLLGKSPEERGTDDYTGQYSLPHP